ARHSVGEGLGLPEALSRQETNLTNRIASTYRQMEVAFQKKNPERHRVLEQELAGLKREQGAFIARLRREQPAYASIRYPEPIRLPELRLGPGEALIEYEVTEKEAFAWLVRDKTVVKALSIPVGRQELSKLVRQYRGFFEGICTPPQLRRYDPEIGHRLYRLLRRRSSPCWAPASG
ncbi:MAG: hypothetical protein AAB270_02985, partial [Chloroflexota bacterium]